MSLADYQTHFHQNFAGKNLMIELHSHSLLSDGDLLPTELLRRAAAEDFETYAITDHVDTGSVDKVITELVQIQKDLKGHLNLHFIAGVEVTHVPPTLIRRVVDRARLLGAQLVVVHGETIAEPVAPGTNRAAIEAACDILAHPGLITDEEVQMARDRGVLLELSGRRGHCLCNGHVARLALKYGADLAINSDAHAPGETMSLARRREVGLGAGLSEGEVDQALANMRKRARRLL
jgi:histidinol phosphatase-like PHP family hydrolase